MDGLKNMIAGGNVQDLVNIFNRQGGDIANTPAAQQISGSFIQRLIDKFGLGEGAASGVAGNLIPNVLQNLVHKTNDPNDSSFNIQDILSNAAGDQQGTGGLNIQGILSQFTGGGTAAGNGILNSLKGVVGK